MHRHFDSPGPHSRFSTHSSLRSGAATKAKRRGFTLVEIMIVVVIIGLLAALAIPAFARIKQKSLATRVANDLKQFASAFEQHAMANGGWPPNAAERVVPTGMEGALPAAWQAVLPGGYRYDWDNNVNSITAAVSIHIPNGESDPLVIAIDKLLDDGVPSTGHLRFINDRCMYILQP